MLQAMSKQAMCYKHSQHIFFSVKTFGLIFAVLNGKTFGSVGLALLWILAPKTHGDMLEIQSERGECIVREPNKPEN